jgi:hypothetical protein
LTEKNDYSTQNDIESLHTKSTSSNNIDIQSVINIELANLGAGTVITPNKIERMRKFYSGNSIDENDHTEQKIK